MRYLIALIILIPCIYTGHTQGSASIISITPSEYCDGNPTGAVDLAVIDSNEPITYFWFGGPDSEFTAETQDVSGLYPGEYCVVITDAMCYTAEICVEVGCSGNCLLEELASEM